MITQFEKTNVIQNAMHSCMKMLTLKKSSIKKAHKISTLKYELLTKKAHEISTQKMNY